jgi:hypothetical protein
MSESEYWFPEQIPHIIIDGNFVPVKNVEILNIEEDVSGRDLLTFKWEGEEKKSFIILK